MFGYFEKKIIFTNISFAIFVELFMKICTKSKLLDPNLQNFYHEHAYNTSKLCQLWAALKLDDKLAQRKQIRSIAVHPGNLLPTSNVYNCNNVYKYANILKIIRNL